MMDPSKTSASTQATVEDASRIAAKRALDLDTIGEAEARKLMSAEHKALGYRPPPGSLASEAQAAATKHPNGGPSGSHPDAEALRSAALKDAARVASERGQPYPGRSVVQGIDLNSIGKAEARQLMSAEHKALGYRPPPGSLAAGAQAAAARHPSGSQNGGTRPGPETLAQAALKDAALIISEREENSRKGIDLKKITKDETQKLQSVENKMPSSTAGSLAAEAQSMVDKRANESHFGGSWTPSASNITGNKVG